MTINHNCCRNLCALLLLLCFASFAQAQPNQRLKINAAELQTLLDPLFAQEMEKEHLPGAVFVLVKDGKVVFAKGYGVADVEKKTPVTPDKTIFRIGSITKVFTTLAVAQLADRKKITLNDDVNKFLSAPKVEEKYGEPVRFWHLLTHTAGFDQIGLGRHAAAPAQRKSLGEFLDGQLRRVRPPGQVSCYDTYGITLAGHLIERTSGLSYGEYLKQNIFTPLGMTRANVEVSDALKPDLALGYGYANGQYRPQRYEYYVTTPASSIDATALDMAQLMIAVLGNGSAGKGRFLSPAMARRLKQPQFTNHPGFPGFAYGFWEDLRNGQRAIHHGGAMLGYLSELYLLPEHKLGFFIAYNRDEEAGGGPARLRDIVTQTLMDHWFPPKTNVVPTALQTDTQRFAGSYAQNLYCHTCYDGEGWGWSVFSIKSAGAGALTLWGQRWLAVEPLVFRREDGKGRLAFKQDAGGRITHLVYENSVYDKLGERLLSEVFGPDWQQRPAEPLAARVYRDSGQWEKAAAAYQELAVRRPDNGRTHYYLGYCWLQANQPDKAMTALERARTLGQWPRDTAYLTACVYAVKGEKDRALEWLEQARKLGFSNLEALRTEPKLNSLRDDPRFKVLLER